MDEQERKELDLLVKALGIFLSRGLSKMREEVAKRTCYELERGKCKVRITALAEFDGIRFNVDRLNENGESIPLFDVAHKGRFAWIPLPPHEPSKSQEN